MRASRNSERTPYMIGMYVAMNHVAFKPCTLPETASASLKKKTEARKFFPLHFIHIL